MKLALVLLTALLAVCQISADVPAFTIDREYRYEYKSRAVTGVLNKEVKQFSGFGTKGTVIIQNQGNNIFLKFDDLQYGQFNGKVNVSMYDEIPMTYAPIAGPYTFIKEALTKPVRVHIEKGLVKSFDVYPEDPEWSVNVKRSILSLFQLDFDRVNTVRASQSNYLKPEEDADFYRVMEDGIGGECETVYQITSLPYYKYPYERVMNVTKNRNYKKCTHRANNFCSTHTGYPCLGRSAVVGDPLKYTSYAQYQIRGDRRYYTIEKVYGTAKYFFIPFGTKSETILTGVNQTLFLTDMTAISTPITFPAKFLTYTSLIYNTTNKIGNPAEIDLTKPNYYNRHFYYKYNNVKEQVGKLLDTLYEEYKITDDLHVKHVPEKFLGLVKLLSTQSYSEIMDIYNTHLTDDYSTVPPEKKIKKTIFYDALVSAGTNPAVKFILYVIQKENIPQTVTSSLFTTVPFHVKEPSEALISEVYKFVTTVDKQAKTELYKTSWLAFGHLVYSGCEKHVGHPSFPFSPSTMYYVHPDTCKKYVVDVYKYFTEAKTTWEQLLYLKVLGNFYTTETYPYLKPIITGEKHYPEFVRSQAFWDLFGLLDKLREEVLTLAVPMYFNYSEPISMRLVAFEMMLYSKPPYSVLQYLADSLHKEPNHQIASYVYSSFVTVANSTNPCDLSLLKKVRAILKTIPPVYYGYQYGQTKKYNYLNDKYLFSGETMVAWSGNNESFIPNLAYVEQSVNIFGYHVDLFSISFESHGLSRIFKRLFGPDGIYDPLDEDKSVFDIFRRHPRNVDTVKKELEEIKQSVNVATRTPHDFEAHLAFTSLGQESYFSYIDPKDFASLKESGFIYLPSTLPKTLSDGIKFNSRKMFLLTDITYEVPTEMGFPLSLSLQTPLYYSLTGEAKFNVEPSIFAEERGHKKTTNVNLVTDLKPIIFVQGFAKMAIKSPSMNTYGYGITQEMSLKFPLKLNMDYNAKEKQFHLKYIPSKAPYELFHTSNRPYTFIDKVDNYVPISEEPTVKPIVYKPTPHKLDLKLGHTHFGAGVHIYREQQQDWDSFSSYYKYYKSFFSKTSRTFDSYDHYYNPVKQLLSTYSHFVDYVYLYPSMRPYAFKLYYEPSTENPTSQYDFTIDFHKHYQTSAGQYHPDYSGDKIIQLDPTFRKVFGAHVMLVAKGNVERSYHLDFNTSYLSLGDTPTKFALNYWRTPVPNYDPEPFKLCYRWSLNIPHIKRYYTIDKETELKATMVETVDFGKNCESDKKITIKTTFEKTEEQKTYDADPYKYPTYAKCKEDIKKGFNFSAACWKCFYKYYELKKYTIDVDYKNLPEGFTHFMDTLSHWIKYKFFLNIDDYDLSATNPPNHIKIVANFSSSKPAKLDLTIYRPTQTIHYDDIYYPAYLPFFQHVNLRRSPSVAVKAKIFNYGYQPVCRLQGDHIETFDNVHYDVPLSTCYHVVAKDCSKGERFMLLAKKVNHKMYNKAMKLFFLNHKIEILPVGENPETAPLVVRVDDTKRNLAPNTLYVMPDPEHKDKPLFKIYNWNGEYIIVVPTLKLRVIYDGTFLNTKISNFLHGFMCGICGDSNGETYNEFVGPNKAVYYKEHPFIYSYLVPDGSCVAPKTLPTDYYYPYAPKYPGKCTIRRNKLVQDVPVEGTGIPSSNVCFSTVPVPECIAGCKPTTYVKRRIGFHCLNTRDAHTAVLTQESKTRELTELKNKSQDYYEVVQYPENCVKA